MSDNVIDLVTESQKRGKFRLADTIKGRGYPEATADIYIDAGAAFDFAELQEKVKGMNVSDPEYDASVQKLEEISEKIKQSKLTFYMRGVGQGEVEAITKKADELYPDKDENWIKYYLCALIAKNIVKVVDFEGNEDDSEFTVEDVIEIRDVVPIDSWEVLIETMQKLTLASSYFDAVVDAGFLPKS